jgi:hypothetical protein
MQNGTVFGLYGVPSCTDFTVKIRHILFWKGRYCLQDFWSLLLVVWRKMKRSSKVSGNFTGLHVVTAQKIALLVETAARTSYPSVIAVVSLDYAKHPPGFALCIQ